jgi:glycosyltransferase involved in cell wall biosynthesis
LSRGVFRTLVQAAAVGRDVPQAVAVSESVRRRLLSANEKLGGRVRVVRGGIDVGVMSELGFGEREMRVVFVGRLVAGKGVWDAIRAFLQAKRDFRELELWIVGDGPLRVEVEEFVRSLSEEHRDSIRLLGEVGGGERFRVMSEAMILVFPSRYEAAPLTPVESLGCGTPFVGYDISALRELRGQVGGGVLVPAGSVSSLGEGLKRMLGSYESFAEEASVSRRRVFRLYSWDRGAERLEQVLLDVFS